MTWRIALGALILTLGVATASAQPSDAYVNQVDRSARSVVVSPSGNGLHGSAYIIQLPETARPVPPRVVQRRAPARAAAPPPAPAPAPAPQTAAIQPARQVAVYPSVGSGVALALSQASARRRLPDVGAGVGAP